MPLNEELMVEMDLLNPESLLSIIISPQPIVGHGEKLDEKGCLERNPDESREDYQQRVRIYHEMSTRPLLEYLDSIGAKYNSLPLIGVVCANVKVSDVYKLGEKPFVEHLIRDRPIYPINDLIEAEPHWHEEEER